MKDKHGRRITEFDEHGPLVVVKPKRVINVGDTCYLRELAPRDTFRMSSRPEADIIGTVLSKTEAAVTVSIHEGTSKHEFTDKAGAHHTFLAHNNKVSQWSGGSLVILVSRPEPYKLSINPVDCEEEYQMAKKSNGKAAPKAAAKKPAAKSAGSNPCKCACGTKTGKTFAPGHDARYFGWLKKVVNGKMKFSELPAKVQESLGSIKGAVTELATH